MKDQEFQLGEWRVSPREGILRAGDEARRLQPRVMDVLLRLVQSSGEIVSRETFLADVWSGRTMSDEPLHRCIAELRASLGDSRENPRFIETLPRRGYRLILPVRPVRGRFRSAKLAGLLLLGASLAVAAVQLIEVRMDNLFTPQLCQ